MRRLGGLSNRVHRRASSHGGPSAVAVLGRVRQGVSASGSGRRKRRTMVIGSTRGRSNPVILSSSGVPLPVRAPGGSDSAGVVLGGGGHGGAGVVPVSVVVVAVVAVVPVTLALTVLAVVGFVVVPVAVSVRTRTCTSGLGSSGGSGSGSGSIRGSRVGVGVGVGIGGGSSVSRVGSVRGGNGGGICGGRVGCCCYVGICSPQSSSVTVYDDLWDPKEKGENEPA